MLAGSLDEPGPGHLRAFVDVLFRAPICALPAEDFLDQHPRRVPPLRRAVPRPEAVLAVRRGGSLVCDFCGCKAGFALGATETVGAYLKASARYVQKVYVSTP